MQFTYRAVDAQGATVKGQIEAADFHAAMQSLQDRGLTPLQVDQAQKAVVRSAAATGKVSANDKALALREIGTLVKAGIPLAESLQSLAASHQQQAVGPALQAMHEGLSAGLRLSVTMEQSKVQWPAYAIQLAQAGEATGDLGEALIKAAEELEYENRVKSDVQTALIYPSVLIMAGIAAVAVVFVFVVPKFATLLKNPRAQIPDFSAWVLRSGLYVSENKTMFTMIAISIVFAMVFALSSATVRHQLYNLISGWPLIGRWIRSVELARWASMLSVLLGSKVTLVSALELAQSVVQLDSLRSRLTLAAQDVKAGKRLAQATATHTVLDPVASQMIAVGERSGQLPQMLRLLADSMQQQSQRTLKRVMTLIEPIAILTIGGAIGLLMLAVMMAITSFSSIGL